MREYAPALGWMQTNAAHAFGIPSLVRMELILGARNRNEQQRIIRILTPYPVLYPNETDSRRAMQQFEKYQLSHQVGIMDAFIAAMAARLKLPIYSRNVKDLSVFDDVQVIAPY